MIQRRSLLSPLAADYRKGVGAEPALAGTDRIPAARPGHARRSLLAFIAATPFIVKAASLMPVWSIAEPSVEFFHIEAGAGFVIEDLSSSAMFDGWLEGQRAARITEDPS